MQENTFKIFKEILEEYKDTIRLIKGVTTEEIKSFENKNNINISLLYKTWLLNSNGGELFLPAGIQLYGISHKPLIEIDKNKNIIIGALSNGDLVFCNSLNEKISILNIETNEIAEDEVYDDFLAFLIDFTLDY